MFDVENGLGAIDLVSFTAGQIEKHYGMIYVDMDDKCRESLERKRTASITSRRSVYPTVKSYNPMFLI
ncbi:MAG: 6-phospho-beta-glucosidase [Erysipelotrichaceae bacterium]|nr:6-phospho-beta-glucosidase [Erysipelotrichaceae bacterium]